MTETVQGWDRRDFLGGVALFAMAIGVPAAAVRLSYLDNADAPTDRQRVLAAEVSDLVIPRTGTAGARDVGVGDFLILALAHGLSGTQAPVATGMVTSALKPFLRRNGSLQHLAWLEQTLNRRANGDFVHREKSKRSAILGALDAEAMAQGAAWSPWVAIKGLILTGYYTSEIGGSKELRYELVPGRFDPDIPLKPTDRAWSSDWSAVEFG